MDLTSGDLYWPHTCPAMPPGRRLHGDVECDVLVVGAGITGAMAAWHLAREGVRVVVVDQRPPVTGSTPASTALVQYEIDTKLLELRTRLGRDHADRAYRAARAALDDMVAVIAELDDSCDLRQRHSLYLASDEESMERLRREAAARREIGLEVQVLEKDMLAARFGLSRPGAVLCDLALEVNPVRLTQALHRGAAARGVRLFAGVEVMLPDVPYGDGAVQTAAGERIRCRQVVVATGYQTPEMFEPVCRLTKLKSTFAIATEPVGGEAWPEEALLWEDASPYLYARTTPDRRIIFGGEDVPDGGASVHSELVEAKGRVLERKLGHLLPRWSGVKVAYSWGGTFAETADGLPYIGVHPEYPGTHFCLGYGGNGITFSLLAAQITTGAITGRARAESGLFGFGRRPVERSGADGGAE